MWRRVLLTVSGTIDGSTRADIAAGLRPRADFNELCAAVHGELVDYRTVRSRFGRLARVLGPDAALAWACRRSHRRVSTVFTDSERVGMLYATLCTFSRHRPRHVMIGHRLSAPKKQWVHRLLRLQRRVDHLVVYSSAQRAIAIERLGYPAERVTLTPFMVDTRFWRRHGPPSNRPRRLICAVGQELRDYPTLIAAVDGLDVDVFIAAASPWSKRQDSSVGLQLPANVSVGGLDLFALRELYAETTLVVVPVVDTDFQAGITTILEAMSMGLPVVCTRTRGQTDTIVEGETGRYVPPGDATAMRAVIGELLADPDQRRRLGTAGQHWVREHADIVRYTDRLAALID